MSTDIGTGDTRWTGWPRAAASSAIFRDGHVLLVQRGKGPRRGIWSLPGGHIEPGETARAAAERELGEETGVTAEIGGLLDVHDVIFRDPAGAVTRTTCCASTGAAGRPASRAPAATAPMPASCRSPRSTVTR